MKVTYSQVLGTRSWTSSGGHYSAFHKKHLLLSGLGRRATTEILSKVGTPLTSSFLIVNHESSKPPWKQASGGLPSLMWCIHSSMPTLPSLSPSGMPILAFLPCLRLLTFSMVMPTFQHVCTVSQGSCLGVKSCILRELSHIILYPLYDTSPFDSSALRIQFHAYSLGNRQVEIYIRQVWQQVGGGQSSSFKCKLWKALEIRWGDSPVLLALGKGVVFLHIKPSKSFILNFTLFFKGLISAKAYPPVLSFRWDLKLSKWSKPCILYFVCMYKYY